MTSTKVHSNAFYLVPRDLCLAGDDLRPGAAWDALSLTQAEKEGQQPSLQRGLLRHEYCQVRPGAHPHRVRPGPGELGRPGKGVQHPARDGTKPRLPSMTCDW